MRLTDEEIKELQDELYHLKRERDFLKADLKKAKAKIQDLERKLESHKIHCQQTVFAMNGIDKKKAEFVQAKVNEYFKIVPNSQGMQIKEIVQFPRFGSLTVKEVTKVLLSLGYFSKRSNTRRNWNITLK